MSSSDSKQSCVGFGRPLHWMLIHIAKTYMGEVFGWCYIDYQEV